jgi:hypothetical protein
MIASKWYLLEMQVEEQKLEKIKAEIESTNKDIKILVK